MDWTGPLQARDFQAQGLVQGLYQSQQLASGFSQTSGSTQNSSAYSGNDQAIKLHCRMENMVPNNLSSQNNVGSNNFQRPLLKSSVPVVSIGTTQHFVGQHPNIQLSSLSVQMASGMAMNTQPNSNVHIFSPVAPQLSTADPVQRPPNCYTTLDMYSNQPQKNCNSVQGSGFPGNKNCSRSKRLPLILPQYQPANLQTHVTVPLNQVSNRFVNPQQNSSCLDFPSRQNIQNQINDINSVSTTAMQNASNSVYSSSYTMPTYYATQVIPQATNTNLPPPPYAVSPIQINHGQFVLPQAVPNTSNQNVQNIELDQRSVSYSVQHVRTPDSVPVSGKTNEVGGATASIHGHSAENQPSSELAKSAIEALKNRCNNLPLDKTSTPQMTTSMVDDNTAKSSENVLDSFIKSKSMRESLELDKKKILELKKKVLQLQDNFKLKFQLYRSVVQKSKACDPSVPNVATSNTSQHLAPPPQATPQTFSPPSHDVTQYPISLPPHDNGQQIQDSSSLPLKAKNHLYPILKDLLKGTIDEEMLLKATLGSAESNRRKQLFFQEKGSTGSVLESSGAESETRVSDMERTSRLSPGTSQTVCNQASLTTTNVSLGFEQISALGKDQLTNASAVSGGDLFNRFLLNKDKMGTSGTKILTNPQSTVSVQKPTESSQLSEKLAKEENRNSQNPSSPFVQQSKDNYLQTKSIKVWNNGNDISNSAGVAAIVPEAGEVQKSSFMGNSCTVGRTFSLEELETSLALWKKSPSTSSNDNFSENAKSTMGSSSMNGEEDKKMECPMKNLPDALTHENSSITVGKNELTLSSVTSSLGQKFDAVNSSYSAKNSEPQVAIVPPLILSKEGIQNEVQEKDLSSMLEKLFSVVTVDSIHSLHKFVPTSDMDKPVKRTAYSPLDSCVTVKEVASDTHQKTARSIEENGIKRAESGTSCSYDSNEKPSGPLELKKNIPQPYSVDSFPPGINKDCSSPVSQNCAPKTSPDLIEPQDTVLSENILQISSVCTLVQGDAFYNSHIANIFNPSSKVEDNTSSEDQKPVSYHKERQLSNQKRESEMNGDTSVGDAGLPSIDTLSKTIAEKLLSLPGLKKLQGGKVLGAMNERESEEEKNSELVNLTSGEEFEQNTSCSDVCSRNLASDKEEVPGNCIADEGNTHGIQDYVPSDENLLHSLSDVDLRSPSDQLTELLKEFPYGIDDSKALKKNENETSAKVNEIEEGQEAQNCGQNSEATNVLDPIIITILNPQQMKELFPERSSQSSNKNQENDKLAIASKNTNESHIHTVLVESTDTTIERVQRVQKPAHHSFCCVQAWLALKYSVDPCKHMLAKEATFKQQFVQNLPSEIKEGSETNETSSNCQSNSQQQNTYLISNNTSEVENNQMLTKTFACRDCDLQEKEKPLKEDKRLVPYPFLEKLELVKSKNKEQGIEELPEKVQINDPCNPKSTTLVSKSQEWLCSGTDNSKEESISTACKRGLSDKGRTPKERVDGKSKSNTLQHSRIENKHNKKREKYKIKRDSSETHIIKGPNYPFKRGFKKHLANEWKNKTEEKLCGVTKSSNVDKVDLDSKVYNNAQHSKEHLNRQICEIERESENNKAVGKEHNISSNSEVSSKPVEYNKNSFSRPNLKKFAYNEERGSVWKYRRSLSDNIKTSKVPTFREQLRNAYKSHSSSKEAVWGAYKREKCFTKNLSDKKLPCNRKNNTLTLQREQKKNYLNKVAFKQTDRSICLTKLEQSPSKSVWHVKSSSVSEYPKDKKDCIPSSQQSEVMKPQMLEFKMCPEIVFRNLVSEEVSDAKKLPERERTPVSGTEYILMVKPIYTGIHLHKLLCKSKCIIGMV